MTDLNLDQFYDRDSYFGEQLDAVNKNFLTNGKKLRAYFLNSIGLSLDIHEDSTYVMARCTEMIHNATLCHDDVIDNATMRRETPSINQQIDNKKSVLVGDFLLARAIQELCELKSLDLLREISKTLELLSQGEFIQDDYSKDSHSWSYEKFAEVALHKTGSLFAWTFKAPYLFVNTEDALVAKISKLGEDFGELFQMRDDLLDFAKETDKTKMIDIENQNINFVLCMLDNEQRQEVLKSKTITQEQIAPALEFYNRKTEEFEKNLEDFPSKGQWTLEIATILATHFKGLEDNF